MAERNYYVLRDDNCKFPAMTKEQILAAITQAVETHEIADVDTGFVTKIKEQNANRQLKFWIGTTAQFEALATKEADTLYILSDDDTEESIETALQNLQFSIDTLIQSLDSGSLVVKKATNSVYSERAEKDWYGDKFIDNYLHADEGYEGNAINGVTIYGKDGYAGGSYFMPVWKSFARNICFGVMWWDGETNTVSAVSNRMSGKRYAVKITKTDEGYGSCYNKGLAKIVQYNDDGTEETLSIQGTTLEMKNLSEKYREE